MYVLGYKGLLNWNKGRLETLSQAASKATQAMSMMSLDEIEHDTDVEMKGPGNKDAQDLLLWRLRLLFHRSALALKENMGRDENVEVSRSFPIFLRTHNDFFYILIGARSTHEIRCYGNTQRTTQSRPAQTSLSYSGIQSRTFLW